MYPLANRALHTRLGHFLRFNQVAYAPAPPNQGGLQLTGLRHGGTGRDTLRVLLTLQPRRSSNHDPEPNGGVIPDDPTDTRGNTGINHRQRRILEQLNAGVESRRGYVERLFKRSARTAKRDLTELRDRGLTSFARKPAPGQRRYDRCEPPTNPTDDECLRFHSAPFYRRGTRRRHGFPLRVDDQLAEPPRLLSGFADESQGRFPRRRASNRL